MSNEVALAEAASGQDPAAGLRAARALRELAERLEALQVRNAREHGWSWQEVAFFLGVSKQAVHKKYAGLLRRHDHGVGQRSRQGSPAQGRRQCLSDSSPPRGRPFVDARQEADQAGQDEIRSEHVLIGLLREPGPAADALTAAGLELAALRARLPRGDHDAPDGLDADALSTLGIDLDAVRRATDAAFGPGALDRAGVPGRRRLPFADDTRRSLAGAVRQAQQLSQRSISSGHMLIGILDERRNGALTLLTGAGADIAALRADVLARIMAPTLNAG